ncbi:MAG: hypothetical protein C0483_26000 [Pirellula sp.]|nr:hypothetical protein [Pirellula sp.]
MPPRPGIAELARLLAAVADPLYVVDERRRLVYVNEACGRWLNCKPEELLGRECRYAPAESTDVLNALATSLCPPPAAFAGEQITAEIVPPREDSDAGCAPRRAMFLPWRLSAPDTFVVAVWLPPSEIMERDAALRSTTAEEATKLHALTARLRREAAGRYALDRLVGVGPSMQRIRAQIGVAAACSAPLSIVGRPGTGRSRIARAVHYAQAASATKATGSAEAFPLVPLESGVLNAELLQSTIRGMIRAARSAGRPSGGTLLLADADLLPTDAQAELAGFLKLVELPLRIMTTSAVSLERHAEVGRFRADLAAWLAVMVIEVPPLASRPEDIAPLAQYFVEEQNAAGDRQIGGFASDALDRLAAYAWPGETVELAEVVRAAYARAEGPLINAADLPARLAYADDAQRYAPAPPEAIDLDQFLGDMERELLQRALAQAKGNKTTAARLLGLSRPRLYRRLVQLGLESEAIVFEEVEPTESDGESPKS